MKNRKNSSSIIQLLAIIMIGMVFISCSTNTKSSYSLTTNVIPSEAGSISPSEGDFDEGEQVQITATANEHWVFTGWGGDHSGTSNPATIMVDDDKSVSALFEKKTYNLKINAEGEGEVTEQLLNAKATDYPAEAIVKLTAVPEDGWTFLEWSGNLSGSMISRTIEVDEPKEITATFVEEEAKLISIVLTFLEKDYSTEISEFKVSTIDEVPFGVSDEVLVKSLNLSPNATSNINEGDRFDVDNPPTIVVTSQSGQIENSYDIVIKKDQDAVTLFDNYSQKTCEKSGLITTADLMLENNLWNTDYLDPGSFSQCVYLYNEQGSRIFGWHWSFPKNKDGVNAYPEIIYGWKPWHAWLGESTTENLPGKISDIKNLKVSYEVKVYRNEGSYNLAFDNWITSSSDIKPENITFELMIWEDGHDLNPFGDYQGEVHTSNGTYDFYMGEPDWEPDGTNWTYLAFKRINYRKSGEVDMDEIINYLLENDIIPEDSYLASIEFGNEVGDSSEGYTIIKEFDVQME